MITTGTTTTTNLRWNYDRRPGIHLAKC